jgi:hypothetical protein
VEFVPLAQAPVRLRRCILPGGVSFFGRADAARRDVHHVTAVGVRKYEREAETPIHPKRVFDSEHLGC